MLIGEAVVSADDVARGAFSEASKVIGRLRAVTWVNPTADEEKPIAWLQAGAKPDRQRRLGFTA